MSGDNRNGERRSDLAVMEANEFKQKRRLERILEAVHRVEDTADDAWEDFVHNGLPNRGREIAIQRAVQRAIREVYTLWYQDQGSENGEGRDELRSGWMGGQSDPVGTVERRHEDDIVIYDLYDFMTANYVYTESVTRTVRRPNLPPRAETREYEYTVPEDVSWEAYARLREYLSEQKGLEITLEELEEDSLPLITGFDQSDPEGDGTAGSTEADYHGPPEI